MIEPYYSDELTTVYCGDARDLLPELHAGVILTDPPYGVGLEYDGYRDDIAGLEALIADVYPLMRSAAPVVALTPGIANMHRWPRPSWCLCWHHINAFAASGPWGFTMWQPVYAYGPDPYLAAGLGRRPDTIGTTLGRRLPGPADRHPCAKPLDAWRPILARVVARPGTLVLDPLAGAGTTLLAARTLGLPSIGIELSTEYCDLIVERLAQRVLDLEGASLEQVEAIPLGLDLEAVSE